MKRKGFTFIEATVSLFIFTVLVLGALQLFIYSTAVQDRCQSRLTSLDLAVNRIEMLKSLGFDHPQMRQNSRIEEIKPNGQNRTFLLNINIEDISLDLKRIVISGSSQNNKHKKVTLAVYVSRQLGF